MKILKNFVKSKLLNSASAYSRNSEGSFAVMGAVTMAVLVAGLSIAIDVSNGWSARQTLQDTTDAIALAAARSESDNQTELTEIAQNYLDLKFPGASGSTVKLESITRNGAVVDVVTSKVQPTYFAGIFGHNGLDIRVASSAEYEVRDLNLALVLDTTGSMRSQTSSGGTKLAALQVAADDLITQLDGSEGEVSISVVPFAQHVNLGAGLANENWLEFPETGNNRAPHNWSGCVGSRLAPLDTRITSSVARVPGIMTNQCPVSPVLPLTKNMNSVRQSIGSLQANGYTYTPAGIAWGWRTLTPSAPFTQTVNQDANKTDNVMVIMTDGRNTKSKSGITHNSNNQIPADRTMERMCENAKRDNIQIYTIAYEIQDQATRDLLENCASASVNFFNATNGDELGDAFSQIATSLTVARITS